MNVKPVCLYIATMLQKTKSKVSMMNFCVFNTYIIYNIIYCKHISIFSHYLK